MLWHSEGPRLLREKQRAHGEGGVTVKCSTSLQFPWFEGQAVGALVANNLGNLCIELVLLSGL